MKMTGPKMDNICPAKAPAGEAMLLQAFIERF